MNRSKSHDQPALSAPKSAEGRPGIHGRLYRIKVRGRLDPDWGEEFEGFEISFEGGNTVLTGPVIDQAALHGRLARIRDLNWTLLLVECLETPDWTVSDPNGNISTGRK